MPRVQAYAILRLRVRFREGLSEALFEELVGRAADTELQEHVEELQHPVSHEDDVFGTLSLNRRFDWYEGRAVWNGARIRLHVNLNDDRDLGAALRTAHLLWQNQAAWNARILECAVAKLVPLKNGTWLKEGEARITADQCRNGMELQDVSVHPDGSFEFWFGAADELLGTRHRGLWRHHPGSKDGGPRGMTTI